MTHPTPDPLRAALDTIHQIIADAKKERDRYGYIAATIRVNALCAGASDEETEAMVRGDKPFIDWLAKQYEAKRLEDAAAPQPAPDREALVQVIREASSAWSGHELRGPTRAEAIADALLAAGYHKTALAAAPQTAAEDQEARAIAEAAQITMTYRNWRGEVAQRTIRPVALWFGKTDWHPEPGWLLSAWDCDKGGRRDFALADCQFAALARPSQAGDDVKRLVEALRDISRLDVNQRHNGNRNDLLACGAVRIAIAALAAMDTPKGGGDE